MSTSNDDETKGIERRRTCLDHSGVCKDMAHAIKNIDDLWKAVGQIRIMFATTMISLVGGLTAILWAILSNRVGL